MDEFLNSSILTFILSVATSIGSAVLTFIATRYNILKPSRLEIKKKQFHCVYLPLYKMFRNCNAEKITRDQISILSNDMNNILLENYELVFPQLHKLSEQLICEIEENKNYKFTLEKIFYQINMEYDNLKNILGYPSSSKIAIYKRMNKRDKQLTWHNIINNFLWLLFLPALFSPAFLLIEFRVHPIHCFYSVILWSALVALNTHLWNKAKNNF